MNLDFSPKCEKQSMSTISPAKWVVTKIIYVLTSGHMRYTGKTLTGGLRPLI